ncbi:sugar ABC transporter permease [Nocardioides szechwanensis]|uniref:Autoinducer 2 import system permease protein LsrD n=1 Tax=Nocardioides szechwanensis TaxID=1005944 RepID=A0A1H0CYF6_9ACTN|nr:ABC transporter permease [Nocardioides szechwanensis]GEP33291.1 sugar ABC transporter permease [Nocardioides szechwanensis]SDN62963.1 rhamnose transport system permease protein [Nocardioides szechwanensis]
MTTTIERAVDERTYASYSRPLLWRLVMTREFAIITVLITVFTYATGQIPNFDGPLTLYYLFLDTAPIMLIALPMTLVIITGEIDLSVASIMGLTSVMLGIGFSDVGLPMPVAILLALAVGAVCGGANGFLVAYVGLPSLAVTIGTLALYRGIAVGLLGTEAITDFPEYWTDLAKQRLVGDELTGGAIDSYPVILIPFVVLLVAFVWLLHFSSFGRGVYEIGLNDEAARFSGVDVERTKMWLFVLSGVVSAFAGIYYTLRFGSARGDNAEYYELQVIAAVLLGGVSIFGGRGALHGVVAGVLLIGVLQSAMRLDGTSTNIANIVIGLLLVGSVMLTSVLSWVSALTSGRARREPPPPPHNPQQSAASDATRSH